MKVFHFVAGSTGIHLMVDVKTWGLPFFFGRDDEMTVLYFLCFSVVFDRVERITIATFKETP